MMNMRAIWMSLMNSSLTELICTLDNKLHLSSQFVNESYPDWYNKHDYSSGYYKGCKDITAEYVSLLKQVLDSLCDIEKQYDQDSL